MYMQRISAIIGAVVVIALIIVIAVKGRQVKVVKATTDVAAVKRDIQEHLPVGSSRGAVEAYLDQRKIPHSYFGEIKDLPNTSTVIARWR
jgi:hypothetical protein